MAAKKKAVKKPAKARKASLSPAKTRKRGRPTKYSRALAIRICARLASGESLSKTSKLESMPSMTTAFRWLATIDEFRDMYEMACAQRVEVHIEGIIDIADNPLLQAQDKRVMIDARKWIASKLKNRKYGDKLEVAGDPDRPLINQIHEKLV